LGGEPRACKLDRDVEEGVGNLTEGREGVNNIIKNVVPYGRRENFRRKFRERGWEDIEGAKQTLGLEMLAIGLRAPEGLVAMALRVGGKTATLVSHREDPSPERMFMNRKFR
jgi:hypothetical protein